ATNFRIKVTFPSGVVMEIRDRCDDLGFDNGILFEGTNSRMLVNRGKLVGAPVEDMAKNPLPENLLSQLYKGKTPGGGNAHMQNFYNCLKDRGLPVSDVFTHHRALTTCHLSNIAIRLGRSLKWDAKSQQIVGDDEANAWQSREQRKGYEVEA
ncbi:MAG: gfo/Idh/MocA family oxidoreductase, partial [Planctomycetales bacterium]|nr:gfo/Idh/MocA family oxidoreductase [Planctomycetales bacterium]